MTNTSLPKLLLAILFFVTTELNVFAQTPTNIVPTNGLIGYWPFLGNANDYSGNGKNGIVNGAVLTTDRFGNPNSAYSFNGSSSNISVNSINIGTQALTVSFWFNSTNILKSQRMVSHDWDRNGNNGSFSTHLDQISGIYGYSGGVIRNTSLVQTHLWTQNTLSNNIWYFFTLTFDGSVLKLYIDNNLVSSALSTNLLNGTQNLFIGGDALFPFSGSLDDIGIWGRVLSQAEITGLFNSSIVSGISDDKNDEATSFIYPNPTTDQITINTKAGFNMPYTISDVTGRIVSKGELESASKTLSIGMLPKGIYMLKVGDQQKLFKLIKQ